MNGNVNGLYGGITDQSLSGIDNGVGYGVASGMYGELGKSQIGILDLYPGASLALSLRRLRYGYNGPVIKVRRSNDNEEMDIGFDKNGDLNMNQLFSFVGLNSGFVSIWYDQSNSSIKKNAIQTNTANQPIIVNNGVIPTANSKPTIQFNSHFFRVIFDDINTTTFIQTFCVINPELSAAADVTTEILWGYAGGGGSSTLAERGMAWGAGTLLLTGERFSTSFSNASINGGRLASSTYSRNANTTILHNTVNCASCGDGNASFTGWYVNNETTTRIFNQSLVINQSSNTSPLNVGVASTDFWIKSVAGASNTVAQKYSELIVYTTPNTYQSGIQSNINKYYSIW